MAFNNTNSEELLDVLQRLRGATRALMARNVSERILITELIGQLKEQVGIESCAGPHLLPVVMQRAKIPTSQPLQPRQDPGPDIVQAESTTQAAENTDAVQACAVENTRGSPSALTEITQCHTRSPQKISLATSRNDTEQENAGASKQPKVDPVATISLAGQSFEDKKNSNTGEDGSTQTPALRKSTRVRCRTDRLDC